MEKAAAGRPPSQFDPEDVPPDWRAVLTRPKACSSARAICASAIYWTRARMRTEGVATLPEGLRLVHGLSPDTGTSCIPCRTTATLTRGSMRSTT